MRDKISGSRATERRRKVSHMADQRVARSDQTFGETLRSLMEAHSTDMRQWTSRSLARALGKDESLVRHWLIGDRFPNPRSTPIESIARILGLTPDETVQMESAYNTSRRLHNEAKSRGNRSSIETLMRPPDARPEQRLPDELANHKLPNSISTVRGEEAIARITIAMYSEAARGSPDGRMIYLTYNGARNFLPRESELDQWFMLALRGAMERGWKVCQMARLDHNIQRSIELVDSIRAYLGAGADNGGAYLPYYHSKQYGTLDVPDGLTLVPGVGALLVFATKQADHVDAGIYFPENKAREHVNLLIEHIERFLQTPGVLKPLLRVYETVKDNKPASDDLSFNEALLTYEQHATGPIFLVKGGFGLASRPESSLADDSTWLGSYTPEERAHWQRIVRERIDNLLRHLERASYRAVCTMSAIEAFVEEGARARDDDAYLLEAKLPPFKPEERWQQLERVVALLRTYPNYELALLNRGDEEALVTTFWEVVGQQAVMLEAWPLQELQRRQQVNAEITEPTLIQAAHVYADEIWRRIPPHQREREWVIWWLEQRMEDLRKKYPDTIGRLLASQ